MALYRIDASHYNDFDIEDVRKCGEEIKFSGLNRRLPEGVYVTDEPIIVDVGDFRGAGKDKTVIIADFPEKDKPILYAGSTPFIEGITLCYREGLVEGNEVCGERVGIYTTNVWPLQKGACIRNVAIRNVGTGILSDKRRQSNGCVAFSVNFDGISVTDFSYRGFDFISNVRTGNIYSDIELSSGKFTCDSAFYFGFDSSEAEESETDITSLKVYDTAAKQPVVLGGARALVANSITLDNVTAVNGDFVVWEKSSGMIEKLEIKNCRLPQNGVLIRVGSPEFISFDTLNYIRIGTLALNGVSGDGKGFNLFYRDEEYTSDYYVKVENYHFSSDTASAVLDEFPVSGHMTFTQKGEGLTPSRLCPFYSKKKDASGRVLIWTGAAWQ